MVDFETVMVPCDKIRPNSFNPNVMDKQTFEALKEDLKTSKNYDPIEVRPIKDCTNPNMEFEAIDGEHKWLAGKELGWTEIRCRIIPMTEDEARIRCYRKNMERGRIDPVSEARMFEYERKKGLSQRQIAKKYGKSQKHVSLRLRMLELPKDILDSIKLRETGDTPRITPEHVYAALPLRKQDRDELLRIALEEGSSVAKTKQIVKIVQEMRANMQLTISPELAQALLTLPAEIVDSYAQQLRLGIPVEQEMIEVAKNRQNYNFFKLEVPKNFRTELMNYIAKKKITLMEAMTKAFEEFMQANP